MNYIRRVPSVRIEPTFPVIVSPERLELSTAWVRTKCCATTASETKRPLRASDTFAMTHPGLGSPRAFLYVLGLRRVLIVHYSVFKKLGEGGKTRTFKQTLYRRGFSLDRLQEWSPNSDSNRDLLITKQIHCLCAIRAAPDRGIEPHTQNFGDFADPRSSDIFVDLASAFLQTQKTGKPSGSPG